MGIVVSKEIKTIAGYKTLQDVCNHFYERAKEYEKELDRMDLNDKDYDWTEGCKDGYEGASIALQFWIDAHKES